MPLGTKQIDWSASLKLFWRSKILVVKVACIPVLAGLPVPAARIRVG